jgi:protein SCO1/2
MIGFKCILAFLTLAALSASAQVASDPIQDVEGVSFEQKLNSQVPLDLEFRDSEGRLVTLRDYVKDGKPVILSLVYYECPMLCNLVMNGMVSALAEIPYQINQDFQVVTLSFDPEETHVLAGAKKSNYVDQLKRPGAAEGWHFLVGQDENIRQVAESVGFTYKWDEKAGEYAHRSGIMLLTPEGRVSRYLPGTDYHPRDLRFGLVDASSGKIGSIADKMFLLCYHYDPSLGQYSLLITRVINGACTLTVLLVGLLLFGLLKREKRIRAKASHDSALNELKSVQSS